MSTIPPLSFDFRSKFSENAGSRVGAEVEGFIVSTSTGRPAPFADELAERLPVSLSSKYRQEFMTAQFEFASDPHESVLTLRNELLGAEALIDQVLGPMGMKVEWRGALPGLVLQRDMIRNRPRTQLNVDRAGPLTSQLATCGLHLHVDAERSSAISVLNGCNRLTPLFVACSGTSGQMAGRGWEAASHRATIWARELPTSGWFHEWQDWDHLNEHVSDLVRLGLAASPKDLHWMVRPTSFGTVEVRAFDMPGSIGRAIDLAALVQCVGLRLRRDAEWLGRIPVAAMQADFVSASSLGAGGLLTSLDGTRKAAPAALADFVSSLGDEAVELGCAPQLTRLVRRMNADARRPLPAWRPPAVATARPRLGVGKFFSRFSAHLW